MDKVNVWSVVPIPALQQPSVEFRKAVSSKTVNAACCIWRSWNEKEIHFVVYVVICIDTCPKVMKMSRMDLCNSLE